MSREKIEVIKDICPFYKEYGSCDRCNTELDIDGEPCFFESMANDIINIDCRKPVEGEWIILGAYNDFIKCSVCGYVSRKTETEDRFCPKCFARMKGETQ